MKTVRATDKDGRPIRGVYWKTWTLASGEERKALYVAYHAGGKLRWDKIPPRKDGTWNLKAAENRRSRLQAKVEDGEFVEPAKGRKTVADLCDLWLADQTCKPQSLLKYRAVVKHIVGRLGDRQLRTLEPRDVEELARDLRDLLDPGYVRLMVSLFRRVLRMGVRLGFLLANPADAAEPKYRTVRKDKPEPLTHEEVRTFLGYVKENRPEWYPFFVTAIWTGMRVGELLAMKWENVDWEARTYTVRENLARDRTFGEPKTPESQAAVPLTPSVLETLRQQQALLEARRQWGRRDLRTDLVFVNSVGKPYDYATVVFKVFKPFLAAAGVREVNFHVLRHTCGSLLLSTGSTMKGVQTHLRHSRIEITMNLYAHLYPEDRAAAAEKLDALLAG